MSAHQEFDPDRPQPEQAPQAEPVAEQGEALDAGEGVLIAAGALQARVSELEAQVAELQDQALRARAEAENARRRAQDEVVKARKFGIESFAESLVPVRDSLEAALAQPDQDAAAWKEGVETTLRQLTNAFERNQLVEIAPAAGEKFDPHRHQAISTVPATSMQPPLAPNHVAHVLQKGYLIADRVLRPALVVVVQD